MKKILGFILSLLCCGFIFAEGNTPRVEVTMPFHKGVNLSDYLEPWYIGNICSTFYGKQDFVDIKSIGADIVRLPIHFEEWSSGKPDYIIPEWLWQKIDEAVDLCTELKLYLIIDFHNDCDGNTKTRPDIEKVLVKIWPQIASRYKDSSEYILYEIYNEPHMKSGNLDSDISKWNKIQGNVLKLIRTIDTKHTVIVGSENWDNVEVLLKLPDYKDDNIIYNFHDYTPHCFANQGADWIPSTKDLKGIPFPYVKEKMPSLPENANDEEKWVYKNYEHDSREDVLCKPLDEAVKFANKRKVALMCNEYGVSQQYADKTERINWYKLKSQWMDERNIIRVSWDYKNKFGIFNSDKLDVQFPQDVNVKLIEAMGYKIPPNAKPRNWLTTAYKDGAYEIYRNSLAHGILIDAWCNSKNGKPYFNLISENGDKYISIPGAKSYENIKFNFINTVDLTSLVNKGLCLEFEVKTVQKDFRLEVYFVNPDNEANDPNAIPWRARVSFSDKDGLNDGQWHKVRIPLKNFIDCGTWSETNNKWYNSRGLFKWNKIKKVIFDFVEKDLTEECCFRNIVIK